MLCPSLQVYSDYSQAMQQPERGHLCFPPQTELKRTDPWLHTCQLMKACNLASVSPPGRDSHQKLPHFQSFQTFIFPKQVAPRNQLSSNFRTKLTLPVAGECFPGEMQTANTRHALQKQHFDGVVLKASELAPIDKHGNPAVSWRASLCKGTACFSLHRLQQGSQWMDLPLTGCHETAGGESWMCAGRTR